MSRSDITRAALVFAAAIVVGVVIGSVVGEFVGYATEWTATGGVFGIALGLFTTTR
ncbi:hypothetical protein [Haloferax sp. DFSO52]|uniref:hypothetical protein n=1 Tax=Haloferax sp. DFSO52 TaxID=3388505 RepID=UPI003A84D1FE